MKATRQKTGCPMDAILRILMGPWTTYILWLLQIHGPMRFGALKAAAEGISAKVLTERLRHLEASGLVHRDQVSTIPPAVTYSLTSRGQELRDVMDGLSTLAVKWQEADNSLDRMPALASNNAVGDAETARGRL